MLALLLLDDMDSFAVRADAITICAVVESCQMAKKWHLVRRLLSELESTYEDPSLWIPLQHIQHVEPNLCDSIPRTVLAPG